jgi:hypothetical protein
MQDAMMSQQGMYGDGFCGENSAVRSWVFLHTPKEN